MKNWIYILLIFIIYSCSNSVPANVDGITLDVDYSKRFEIKRIENGYTLKVFDRFNINNSFDYILTKDATTEGIKIPISRAICLSTTHCAFISQLGEITTIKGIGGTDYVCNSEITKLIENKKILDIGYDKLIDHEKIIALKPDVVFAFGVDNSSMSGFNKLNEIGIPVIYISDFLEEHPLGRTEWIKFFGCFYDKYDYANNFFDSVANNYNTILTNIKNNELKKPKVLVGLPWQGTWWVPGGKSFFANFIKDAGGEYIYGENDASESIPHTLEEIYTTAQNIEIWLHPNSITTRKEIVGIDDRLEKFPPTVNAKIFNNNKRININGGNDYWESGIIHPDVVLNDLKTIFFSNTNLYDDLFYYQEID